jgi:hypothetical protein
MLFTNLLGDKSPFAFRELDTSPTTTKLQRPLLRYSLKEWRVQQRQCQTPQGATSATESGRSGVHDAASRL